VTFEIRLAVLVLAAFAAASLAASVLVPWVAARITLARPRSIATALTTVRLLPAGAGLIVATVVFAAFLIFEDRSRIETTGVLLQVLAVLTLFFTAAFAVRWYLITRQTRRLIARWLPNARPIVLGAARVPAFVVASGFPVIGVIGVVRPRLIVAQSVLDACTPEELEAILAHEQAHIERRDNLWRALLMAAPDVLTWLPISRRLQSEWHAATEEAADDCAGRLGQRGRPLLAQALVKVARLAVSRLQPGDLPATALYRGDDIERRVRRLLAPEDAVARPHRAVRIAIALACAAWVVASLESVHLLLEAAVHGLP
jgi:Zn-dependent protease with chaperone function